MTQNTSASAWPLSVRPVPLVGDGRSICREPAGPSQASGHRDSHTRPTWWINMLQRLKEEIKRRTHMVRIPHSQRNFLQAIIVDPTRHVVEGAFQEICCAGAAA